MTYVLAIRAQAREQRPCLEQGRCSTRPTKTKKIMPSIKKELLALCKDKVQQKIKLLQQSMNEIQAAANEETKSSAGDKYETGRAMMHLEKEKFARQLAEQIKLLETLNQIDPEKSMHQGGLGALIHAAGVSYFLSASLGKIVLEDKTYFALSVAAPLGQHFLGKKAADQIQFRGKNIQIDAVE
jgi:transcription elongation GreA/GreB family factor